MDPYRARTIARFVGLGLLLVFVFALIYGQRWLLRLRDQRDQAGGQAGPGRFVAPAVAEQAARRLFGEDAVVAASQDLDADGGAETLVVRPHPRAPADDPYSRLLQVAVLAPARGQVFITLFNTGDETHLPRPQPAQGERGGWRAHLLTVERMDLEALRSSGEPAGLRIEVFWDGRNRSYRVRELVAAGAPPVER